MKHETIEAIAHSPQILSGAKASVGGGSFATLVAAWAWLGDNASQLTVIFGFVGMVCAVSGQAYMIWRSRKDEK